MTRLLLGSKVGILSAIAAGFVNLTLNFVMVTFDLDSWYSGRSTVTLLIVLMIGVWAFRVTTTGRPLLRYDPSRS